MDVKEIAVKLELNVEEMCFLIEEYIKEKRGVSVKVSPRITKTSFDIVEYQKMFYCFSIASEYFATKDYGKE